MADKENQKMGNSALRIFIGCFAATILLLFRHGYVFGSGDQSEMLPYAKYLADNSLYPSDFYIQSIAASVPNERFVFSWLLSLFGDRLNWAVFGLHFSATMLLILGLYRITSLALDTEGARWLAALAPVLLLYDVNLGGNELYYNIFVPSYVAQVIGIWVFVYGIKGNAFKFFGLLILMTYIHPLIGLQLWLLLSLSFLIVFLKDEPQKKLGGFFIFSQQARHSMLQPGHSAGPRPKRRVRAAWWSPSR